MTENETDDKEYKKAALRQVMTALYLTIKEFGEVGVPSGQLYSVVCGKMSLENYQLIINALVSAGLITNKGHLLQVVRKDNSIGSEEKHGA